MQEAQIQAKEVYIATRESRLALVQAHLIAHAINEQFALKAHVLPMTTKGDQVLDRALSLIGGKGVFVKELEQAMLEGQAHLAVHSLKDVPMSLPEGFVLAAITQREDPRDAFISNHYACLEDLPQGAIVGTSSLRRQVLLKALRPDLHIQILRGNLDTRLKKLDNGLYDAIVLAVAGLKRLNMQDRIRCIFDANQMIPSAGQGALGIEMHTSQPQLIATLSELTHTPTYIACIAERAVSRTLGGSCSVPLAAHATWVQEDMLQLVAAWGDVQEQQPLIKSQHTVTLKQSCDDATIEQAQLLGQQVAADLLAQGAKIALPQ